MNIPERNAWRAFKGARTLLDSVKKKVTDDDLRKRNPASKGYWDLTPPCLVREKHQKFINHRGPNLEYTDAHNITRTEARKLTQRLAYWERKRKSKQ